MEMIASNLEVEFSDYKSVEPKDLLCFTSHYVKNTILLRNYLIESGGKKINLIIARIDKDGKLNFKTITGLVTGIEHNLFNFLTEHDLTFSNAVYEPAQTVEIRFDNVLGNIPLLPSYKENPFQILEISKMYKQYIKSLVKMKKLLTSCVGKVHTALLYYHYDVEHSTFRNGNYCVEVEISEVNKSNVKYKHIRTMAYVDPEKTYVRLGKTIEHDRFITPDRYLRKASVRLEESKISGYDHYESMIE